MKTIFHARRMAFIQCFLTGITLGWFLHPNEAYKQDWSAFVHVFRNQFSSQKQVYYAQVEALTIMEKDDETIGRFSLKNPQLIEKGSLSLI